MEWLNEATLRHPPPELATRLRSAWRFKSSHPHATYCAQGRNPLARSSVRAKIPEAAASSAGRGFWHAPSAEIPHSRDGWVGESDDDL